MVLRQNPKDFVNLSLNPDFPIEDDEVHVWTASIDERYAHGKRLSQYPTEIAAKMIGTLGMPAFKLPLMD